jgi:hypothetical protein
MANTTKTTQKTNSYFVMDFVGMNMDFLQPKEMLVSNSEETLENIKLLEERIEKVLNLTTQVTRKGYHVAKKVINTFNF